MSKASTRDEVEDAIDNTADKLKDDEDEGSDDDRKASAGPARKATLGVLPDLRWSRVKNTFVIAKREFLAYFDSPLAYVLIGLSMIAVGVKMFFLEGNFWQLDRASMGLVFQWLPWTLTLVCAVITMRSLAEEKRMGTLELLITFPVRDSEVILGKYFGALGLVAVLLLVSLLYPIMTFFWPWHLGPLDWGTIWTGYIGLLLWAGAATAIGMFFSSITDSQIVSFFVTFFVLLALQSTGLLVDLAGGWFGDSIAFISFQSRYQDFARGLIDTRAVLYFLSHTVIFLLLAFRNLESRKWK
jgi:ABC-2 type transport system permease protein